MPSKKKAAKKSSSRKKTAKKATSKKSAAKSVKSRSTPKSSGLSALMSKIQVELESGKKRKFSKADIAKAQECLSRTGKILVSFKPVQLDGTGTGSGTGTTVID